MVCARPIMCVGRWVDYINNFTIHDANAIKGIKYIKSKLK